MADLKVVVDTRDGHLVISLSGELTVFNSGIFNDALEETIDTAGLFNFIVDLSATAMVDSCGLGLLVELLKRARKHDGSVHLVGAHAGLLEILYRTKLDKIFERHGSIEEAIAATSGTAEQLPGLPGNLRLVSVQTSKSLVLHLLGNLIESTVGDFRQALAAADPAQLERGLILQLGELEHTDSAGLECLQQVNHEIRRAGGLIWLVMAPAFLTEMLHYAHLDLLFPRYESVEDAVSAQD